MVDRLDYEVRFDVQEPYHIEVRRDGSVWVEGDGLSVEMDSMQDAVEFVTELKKDPDRAIQEYLQRLT